MNERKIKEGKHWRAAARSNLMCANPIRTNVANKEAECSKYKVG